MKSRKPLTLSIAMATFNGSRYVREQLESFMAQTRLPDEVVVSDDNSTDDTFEIIKAFAAEAPFAVRLSQNQRNLGYTSNFNRALIKTSGNLVFLSDQDDVWFPEKLAVIESYAQQSPTTLVFMNDAALTDQYLNETGLTKRGQIISAGMSDSDFVMGCCLCVRRELLDACLPIPTQFKGHDSWIVKMAEGVHRKVVVPDVLQWYRRHETNTSQFIANKTTKVTRGMALKRSFINAVGKSHKQKQLQVAFDQAKCFLEGVQNASRCTKQPLASALSDYSETLEKEQAAIKQRLLLLKKTRLTRLPDILRLWRTGGYARFHGARSAVRDMFFR